MSSFFLNQCNYMCLTSFYLSTWINAFNVNWCATSGLSSSSLRKGCFLSVASRCHSNFTNAHFPKILKVSASLVQPLIKKQNKANNIIGFLSLCKTWQDEHIYKPVWILQLPCPGGQQWGIRPFLQDQVRKSAQYGCSLAEDKMVSSTAPENL